MNILSSKIVCSIISSIFGASLIGRTSNVKISLLDNWLSVTATEISILPKKFSAGITVKILSLISPDASPDIIVSK